MVIEIEDFEQDVLARSATMPVLVDFWAEWCRPCVALGRTLEALVDSDYGDRIVLAKLDTAEHPEVASRYDVRGLPTVKIFRDAEPVGGFSGVLPKMAIRKFLDEHCSADRA